MTALGTSTGEYGGSYSTNSTSSETASLTGPYKDTSTFTPTASETATLTGPYKATVTFTPVGTDPSQLTYQPEITSGAGSAAYRRIGLGAPPG